MQWTEMMTLNLIGVEKEKASGKKPLEQVLRDKRSKLD